MTEKVLRNLLPMKAVAILNRVPLFQQLTTHEKTHIVENLSLFIHIPADDEFIKLGEVDDSFYVILSGQAVVIHSGEELTRLDAGHFVGETGFIGSNPRSASVMAETDIIALKFTRKTFQVLPSRVRETIKDHIIEGLVERVEELNVKIVKEIKAHRDAISGNEEAS